MKDKLPYTCICCGYEAIQKNDMRKHLYKKKPCPQTKNIIELTDQIKDHIMKNKVYHLPEKTPQQIINNTINYNNTINNLITNMDTADKLTKYISFNDHNLIDIDTKLEDKFKKNVQRLENNRPDQDLDKHVLFEMIDQVCSLAHDGQMKDFNIVYDEKFNRLKLYDSSGVWEESILIVGIRNLLIKIQEYYFDPYERYLIRKIRADDQLNGPRQMRMMEHLKDYYQFIECFDIEPFVKNSINDTEILYNTDDDRYDCLAEFTEENTKLVHEFREKFKKIKDNTTKSFVNDTKKNVIDIIKHISKKNVDELNKKVISLFNMDEDFKKIILSN